VSDEIRAGRGDLSTRLMQVPADLEAGETSGAVRPEAQGSEERAVSEEFRTREVGLEILNGPARGQVHALNHKRVYALGRSPECDITTPDQAVSRRHAQLTWVKNRLWLEDLASSNGTSVNGEGVDRISLRDGDLVQAGETELLVCTLQSGHPSLEGPVEPVSRSVGSTATAELPIDAGGRKLHAAFGSLRTSLRDLERALVHTFRYVNEIEHASKAQHRALKGAEKRASEAVSNRIRMDDELDRARLQVRGLEELLRGRGGSEEDVLRRSLDEKETVLTEATERIRALEREVSSLHGDLEAKQQALQMAKAALDEDARD